MKERFMIVNAFDNYFKGKACFCANEVNFSKDTLLNVLDFKDFTIQRAKTSDLYYKVDRELFFNPVTPYSQDYYFTYILSITDHRFFPNSYGMWTLKTRDEIGGIHIDKKHSIYIRDVVVSIDTTDCGAVADAYDFDVYNRGTLERLWRFQYEVSYIRMVFVYRLKDWLILCFQVETAMQLNDSVYSISLAYDINTKKFMGYCTYGSSEGLREENKQFYLPSLAKEMLRC